MARWTDLAVWRGPTVNQTKGHVECRGLVIHIAEGSFEGTIAWQKNPDADVSSHFVTDLDGAIAQCVDTDDTAWTQRAGNGHWLSVENAGHTPGALTAAQCEAVAKLLAKGHQVYGYPLQLAISPDGMGLGHHSMGTNGLDNPTDTWTGATWGHTRCPGPAIVAQKPAILARAQQIINGGDMAVSDTDLEWLIWRVEAIIKDLAVVRGGPGKGEENVLHDRLDHIDTEIAELKTLLAAGGGGLAPSYTITGTATPDSQ